LLADDSPSIHRCHVLYPFSWSSCSAPGTLRCHHFQSVASRLKTLPDADVTNVESYDVKCQTESCRELADSLTKSNAAILLLPVTADCTVDAAYRPTSRLLFTMRQVIFSGSFFDTGVKKFATALPGIVSVDLSVILPYNILVVVDCCFRFDSGGDTPRSFELGRFARFGRCTIFFWGLDDRLAE
jgi:hypothetical protein